MAWTQADVDELKRLMARGVRKGRMPNGEEVEFGSQVDMERQLRLMEAEVAGAASTAGAFQVIYPAMGRGL